MNVIAKNQIIKIEEFCKKKKPLVVVQCLTFNHKPYIRDALEGFVNQKTDFPFVVIVHDDASTDSTASIIKEYAEKYPDVILSIYENENQYSKRDGSLDRIMTAAIVATSAKYVAFCEGDDYWTDPLKLQKQVDFLESHPDYGMCYTKVGNLIEETKLINKVWGGTYEYFLDIILKGNVIPTVTAVVQTQILRKYYSDIIPEDKGWLMGDLPIWLYFSYHYKIKFLNYITGVYRELNESASHSSSIKKWLKFNKSYEDIILFFCNKYSTSYLNEVRYKLFKKYFKYYIANDNEKLLQVYCLDRLEKTEGIAVIKKWTYVTLIKLKFCHRFLNYMLNIYFNYKSNKLRTKKFVSNERYSMESKV